jgi:DNA-binding beta-propeller fold protein YncE
LEGVNKPWGVAAKNGILGITDTGKGQALIMDTVKKTVRTVGRGPRYSLKLPLGIALSSDNIVFVADAGSKKVIGYDQGGAAQVVIGQNDDMQNPAGMGINEKLGRLYVTDSYGHVVRVYSLKGEKLLEFGTRGNKPGEFNYPTQVSVDEKTGNVYVSDTQNFRIQVFDQDGKFIRKVGELGDRPGMFSRPKGIAIDSESHLYVADAAFGNIQVFDEEGKLLLVFGAYGIGGGEFQLPAGIAIDEQDRIYVADQGGMRVLVFQYLSEAWRRNHPEEYQKYLSMNAITQEKTDQQKPGGKTE